MTTRTVDDLDGGAFEVSIMPSIPAEGDDTPEEAEVYETIWGRFDFGGEG